MIRLKYIKIAIVHYNTPKLTECLIKSINKVMSNTKIYVFDNSDKMPFINNFKNVTVFDNTKGQYINFDEWLTNFPDRFKSGERTSTFGSAKHSYSIEKCIELIDDNFILLDSDILLKKDISDIIDNKCIYSGEVVLQPKVKDIFRVLPFICYINVKMCKKYNIHYFNPQFMHGLYMSKKGDMYDTGGGFYEVTKSYPHKDIICNDYIVHYKGGSWESTHDNVYGKNISSDEWLKIYKNLWSDETTNNKKVIYTCITGNYDNIIEHPNFNGYDFICFTDNEELMSRSWQIKILSKKYDKFSTVKKQRYVKTHPHEFLKEYDLSIWVDGSILVKDDPTEIIKEDSIIQIPKHPDRDCIYSEGFMCIKMKKDTSENINKQLNKYRDEGYPEHYGLVQSNIIIRKHNTKECIALMNTWWNEINNESHRDQLSFNYACWKNPNIEIDWLDKKIFNSKWFFWYTKHGEHAIKTAPKSEKIHVAEPPSDLWSAYNLKTKPSPEPENIIKNIVLDECTPNIIISKPLKRIFY